MDDEDQRSEYSEDFEEEVVQDVPADNDDSTHRGQTKVKSYTYQRKSSERSGDRASKAKKAVKKRLSSNFKLTPYKHNSSLSVTSPKDRVISARVHEISALQNDLAEKKAALENLHKENKLLLRLQARQEKELSKLQHQEGELPQILVRHAEEVRVLREQLRRSQEASHAAEKKLAEVREELHKMSGRTKELEGMAKKKDLMERVALTLELQQANDTINSKDRKIAELERNCEVLTKTHAQEVKALMSKNRTLAQEAEDLRETIQIAQRHLKEKEKELDVLNIYSQRISCTMPKGLTTHLHIPLTECTNTQTEHSFPPTIPVSLCAIVNLITASTQTEAASSFFQPLSPPAHPVSKQEPSTSLPPTDTTVPLKLNEPNKPSNPIGNAGEIYKESLNNAAPQIEVATRTVSTFDGSHVESSGTKQVTEKSVPVPSVATMHGSSSEEEDRQKKELLLAKLRALSNGPPASVPLRLSKNTGEPTGPVIGSKGPPGSDNLVAVQHASSADIKGIAPTVHMHTKDASPQPHATADLVQDSRDNFPKPARNEPDLDPKQLLLAKLMSADKPVPADQSKETPRENKSDSTLVKPLTSEAEAATSKQLLLAKLMAIDTAKKTESSKSGSVSDTTDILRSVPKPDNTHTISGLSSQSKLENMHKGKPAFATEDDPFGFRLISAEKKKQKESNQSASGGTFITENGNELPLQIKPKFGRRVQAPTLQAGNPPAPEQSLLSSVQVSPQPYQPSFMSLLKDTSNGAHVPASNGGSSVRQVGTLSPEESTEDTEQKKVAMAPASTVSYSSTSQKPAKPLLPLRPKATESTFDLMPGAIQGNDDDVEEITL